MTDSLPRPGIAEGTPAPQTAPPASRLVWHFGITIIAAILVGAVVSVVVLRDRETESWRAQLSTMSMMLAEQTSQTMTAASVILNGISDHVREAHFQNQADFRATMSTRNVHDALREKIQNAPQVDVASIVAANGDNLNFTRSYPVPSINLAERDYFKAHLANPKLGDFISTAVRNKANGKWTFYISRRLNDAQGRFMGLTLVGLSVDAFTGYYERLIHNLGPGATILLYRQDLTLLASAPYVESAIGVRNTAGSTHEVIAVQRKTDAVIVNNTPRFTTREATLRLAAIRETPNFPLVVSLIVPEDIFLANWRRSAMLITSVTLVSMMLLLLSVILLAGNLDRREQSERDARLAREETDAAEKRLSATLESAPNVVVQWYDTSGRLLYWNQASVRLFGWSDHDAASGKVGMPARSPQQAARFSAMLEQAVADGKPVGPTEIEFQTNSQRSLWLEITLFPIPGDTPGDPVIVCMGVDISERKSVDRMKNEFVSTVSHELRTPLTSIRGSLGLITGGALGHMPENMQMMLAIASNNTDRLLTLINDILDVQKIEAGRMDFHFEEISLMSVLERAVADNQSFATQFGVQLRITGRLDGARIHADRDRLMQVLANLLSNAAKFSQRNSDVQLSITRIGDGLLRVSVQDAGIGIPEEFHSRIFQAFSQVDSSDSRNKGGSGLGLTISRAIIQQHGGIIDFVSESGRGTTFYFDLPEMVAKDA